MSRRRNRSKKFSTVAPSSITHRKVTVTVAVPARMSSRLRYPLVAPPISQYKSRTKHKRIALVNPGKVVTKKVTVYVPRSNRPRPSKVMLNNRGWLTIFGGKNVASHVRNENNRRRRDESKRNRKRYSSGYLDSTRKDTGVISANRRSSAERLADAAIVNRALGG